MSRASDDFVSGADQRASEALGRGASAPRPASGKDGPQQRLMELRRVAFTRPCRIPPMYIMHGRLKRQYARFGKEVVLDALSLFTARVASGTIPVDGKDVMSIFEINVHRLVNELNTRHSPSTRKVDDYLI